MQRNSLLQPSETSDPFFLHPGQYSLKENAKINVYFIVKDKD